MIMVTDDGKKSSLIAAVAALVDDDELVVVDDEAFMARTIFSIVLIVVCRTFRLECVRKGNKRGSMLSPLSNRINTI